MKGWTRADIDARKRDGFTECNPSDVAASMRGLVVSTAKRTKAGQESQLQRD